MAATEDAFRVAYVADGDSSESLVFAHLESGTTLEIVRAAELDDAATSAEEAPYCVVVNSNAAMFGGVERWELNDDVVTFWFTPKATRELTVMARQDIEISAEDLEVVREHLGRMLKNDQA